MFDKHLGARRVAVIGAGISGMGAALRLAQSHQVTLFEAEPRLGGHARTKLANGEPVDTGFIVFNYANYPLMTALFDELDVPVTPSDMSFGASIDGGRIEYGLRSGAALLAQKRNLLRPGFARMIRDVLRFNARALDQARPGDTMGDLLDRLGLGDWFRAYYILPLSGAIWSTPKSQILDFPADAMLRFFDNHALLHHKGQHQWWTVDGGSVQYVTRLDRELRARGVTVRLGTPLETVRRGAGVQVRTGGDWEQFDEVVFATHSDISLRLLEQPTPDETRHLSRVRYQPNHVVLHSDPSVMPKRTKVWASWNYCEQTGKATDQIDLTYWMNSLQPWLKQPLFVTLNSTQPIDPALVHDDCTLHHPVYDLAALDAQRGIAGINGQNATWFCGAWMKNGFHEDGLSSAMDVVTAIQSRHAIAAQ